MDLLLKYFNIFQPGNPAGGAVLLAVGHAFDTGGELLRQLEQLLRVQPRSNPNAINYPKEIAIFIGGRCYEGHMFSNPQMGVVHCWLANIVEKHVWHCVALLYDCIYI